MDRFTTLCAIACPLGLANVDTDQLISARFMKRPRSEGYGGFLLHDLRHSTDGARRPDFILDAPRYTGARILVARRNFGTGSSREAAVYALVDFGIRAVIAPSFGDIFASNAVKNGLLPAAVQEEEVEQLLDWLAGAPQPMLTINLETGRIIAGALDVPLQVDPVRRLQLLNGWDDIDLTDSRSADIARYRKTRAETSSWAFPATGITGA
jgi:3-isopropylmalate/(R)-2-methylmalate dehydratase small subunit